MPPVRLPVEADARAQERFGLFEPPRVQQQRPKVQLGLDRVRVPDAKGLPPGIESRAEEGLRLGVAPPNVVTT